MSGWGNKDYANNKPKFLVSQGISNADTVTANNNTILISSDRLANANSTMSISNKQFAHTGWNKITTKTVGGITRRLSECLVVESSPVITSNTSGNPYFTS